MCIITGLFKKCLAPDKQIKYEDDSKILLLFTGSLEKKKASCFKRQFPSGQLMNTDHMVVSRFDAKINTLVCTLGT